MGSLIRRSSLGHMNALSQLLHNTSAKALVELKPTTVDVEAHVSLEEVLQILKQYNLVCLPVYGEPNHWLSAGGSSDAVFGDKLYIGLLSITDIISFLLDADDASQAIKRRCADAIGKTNEGKSLWCLGSDQTLWFSLEPLSKNVHRLLYSWNFSGSSRCSVITRTDLIRFIWSNLGSFATEFNMTVKEAIATAGNVRARPIDTVYTSTTSRLVDALVTMEETQVSALPVVNEHHQVVGSFSLSDFRGLTSNGLHNLRPMSLVQFLSIQQDGTLEQPIRKPVVCRLEERLVDVLQRMLDYRVHQMWVTSEQSILLDVLSMSDVLTAIRCSCS